MQESQIKLAESIEGLIGPYTQNEDESVEEARERLSFVNFAYGAPPLRDAMRELETTINGSINKDVYLGTVRAPTEDVAMRVEETNVTFPLSADAARALYAQLDPSLVGVERRGTVLDTALRMSHEASTDVLHVTNRIATFDFPEEIQKIQELLCPSAISIRAELYKFIVYGEGDFFVPHRDSMASVDMLGTISMQLPVIQEPLPSEEEEENNKKRKSKEVGVKKPGLLVLYVGRGSSEKAEESLSTNSNYTEEYTEEKQWAQVVDLDALGTAVGEDGSIAMSYAAWTGDVLHEVRRLEHGHRVVLVYRLYKQGHRESYIPHPLRLSVSEKMQQVMHLMSNIKEPSFCFIGVILRHSYPPAGLRPEYLKGIDTVMHSIASMKYRCLLFNAHDVREGSFGNRHAKSDRNITHAVFLTAGEQPNDVAFSGDEALNIMAERYKIFSKTVWIQLGLGSAIGGGFCYGNVDCGTDWWYRSAVMIITQEPSLWVRRRNLLLVMIKGPECMRRLNSNQDVMERIASFL